MTTPVVAKLEFSYRDSDFRVYSANTGFGLPTHSHLVDHVTFCLAGSCRVTVGDKTFVLTDDSRPVVLPANIPHEIEALEDGTVFINILPN